MADALLKEDGTRLLLENGFAILLRSQVGQKFGAPPIVRYPAKLQFRRGTTAEWAANNPVLASGEPGVDLTTGAFKIGDGTTAWQSMATQYAPQSMVNNPRGVVAVGDGLNPAPTLNASSIDLTSGILYTFDPTRRYRANYTIRAQSSATTIQFQLINVLTGALLGSPSDHIPGSPVATVVGYSGSYFNWLFTASGPMELRVRTTTYYTAGTIIYSIGTGGFYIEDMGAI